MRKQDYVLLVLALLIFIMLMYALGEKAANFHAFTQQVSNIPYIEPYSVYVSVLFLGLEFAIAVWLLIARSKRAFTAAFSLMLFLTALIWILPHNYHERFCSCIGLYGSSWRFMYWHNIVFTLISALGISFTKMKTDTYTVIDTSRRSADAYTNSATKTP